MGIHDADKARKLGHIIVAERSTPCWSDKCKYMRRDITNPSSKEVLQALLLRPSRAVLSLLQPLLPEKRPTAFVGVHYRSYVLDEKQNGEALVTQDMADAYMRPVHEAA